MKSSSHKLKLTLPSDREIEFTRKFAAPLKLVFAAFTQPTMVKRWLLGPDGWTMPVCEIDLRVGGKYRYVWQHGDGREMGLSGTYREITAPTRLVFTEKFDDAWYPGQALITVEFHEEDGLTTMSQRIRYASKAARDGILKSGMKKGVVACYDRLEKILSSRKRI